MQMKPFKMVYFLWWFPVSSTKKTIIINTMMFVCLLDIFSGQTVIDFFNYGEFYFWWFSCQKKYFEKWLGSKKTYIKFLQHLLAWLKVGFFPHNRNKVIEWNFCQFDKEIVTTQCKIIILGGWTFFCLWITWNCETFVRKKEFLFVWQQN